MECSHRKDFCFFKHHVSGGFKTVEIWSKKPYIRQHYNTDYGTKKKKNTRTYRANRQYQSDIICIGHTYILFCFFFACVKPFPIVILTVKNCRKKHRHRKSDTHRNTVYLTRNHEKCIRGDPLKHDRHVTFSITHFRNGFAESPILFSTGT